MDKRSPLILEDYQRAAIILGCEVEAIQAVAQVEAAGSGFFPNNEPKTLFEGHKFYKYTNGAYHYSHPGICYPKWTKKWYGKTWEAEYRRFIVAFGLDKSAAILSASFGKFQVMGFNFNNCGFLNEFEFYGSMKLNEQEHLNAFVILLKTWGLDKTLSHCDWRAFAKAYNGPRYEENNYHVKLEDAYNTFKNY